MSHHCRETGWSYSYCPPSSLWKIHLTVVCLIHSPHRPPDVHHQTSTILTSVEEISCQAFILLRDQGPSCSCLNITSLHCRFEIAGAGGISFIRALETQNALAWPLGFGGIIWWIHVLQQLLGRSHQGSKSGCECPPPIGPYGHFQFSWGWNLTMTLGFSIYFKKSFARKDIYITFVMFWLWGNGKKKKKRIRHQESAVW